MPFNEDAEREAFERWALSEAHGFPQSPERMFRRTTGGEYADALIDWQWRAWRVRAIKGEP